MDVLTQASHKLAEMMYASAAQGSGQTGGAGDGGTGGGGKPDDVVDAEFEEVKGDQK
jgi:molecular chaperone DnaK